MNYVFTAGGQNIPSDRSMITSALFFISSNLSFTARSIIVDQTNETITLTKLLLLKHNADSPKFLCQIEVGQYKKSLAFYLMAQVCAPCTFILYIYNINALYIYILYIYINVQGSPFLLTLNIMIRLHYNVYKITFLSQCNARKIRCSI